MSKIKMFEQMWELDKQRGNTAQRYGKDHKYTEMAEVEWNGARLVLQAAGLYDEYFEFKMKKLGVK